jgi:hypothetical protein
MGKATRGNFSPDFGGGRVKIGAEVPRHIASGYPLWGGEVAPRFRTDPLSGKVLKQGREGNPCNSATHRPNRVRITDSYSPRGCRLSHVRHGPIC